MEPIEIERLIAAGLPDAEVTVEGDGAHFTALVISPLFANQSRIKRQQLVYDTVRPQLIDGRLHALSLKTYTPEEWQQLGIDQS